MAEGVTGLLNELVFKVERVAQVGRDNFGRGFFFLKIESYTPFSKQKPPNILKQITIIRAARGRSLTARSRSLAARGRWSLVVCGRS